MIKVKGYAVNDLMERRSFCYTYQYWQDKIEADEVEPGSTYGLICSDAIDELFPDFHCNKHPVITLVIGVEHDIPEMKDFSCFRARIRPYSSPIVLFNVSDVHHKRQVAVYNIFLELEETIWNEVAPGDKDDRPIILPPFYIGLQTSGFDQLTDVTDSTSITAGNDESSSSES